MAREKNHNFYIQNNIFWTFFDFLTYYSASIHFIAKRITSLNNTAGAGYPPNGTKSCAPMLKTLLPARETRSAHSFWAVFTAKISQSGSGSGLSFCTNTKHNLFSWLSKTHRYQSRCTYPQDIFHIKDSNLPSKHLWGSFLSEISGHLSEWKLTWKRKEKNYNCKMSK